MSKEHYDLLVLKNAELSGPLAKVLPADAYPRDLKSHALKALSHIHPNGILLLGLDVGLDAAGQFFCEPTGLLAGGLGRKMADNVTNSIRRKGEPLLKRDNQSHLHAFPTADPFRADDESIGQSRAV